MRLFKDYLPEIETASVYELLARRECAMGDGSYAVFDPCMARDFPKMERAVRKLTENAGLTLTELPERNHCCGFGGHMRVANPGLYDTIAGHRAAADEAPYIVYCAHCAGTFALAGKPHIHVLDLFFPPEGPGVPGATTGALPVIPLQRQRDNASLTKSLLTELFDGGSFDPAARPWDAIRLEVPPSLVPDMDRRLILEDDLKEAIYEAERTGDFFVLPCEVPNDAANGTADHRGELRQCCLVRDVVTTWVQYTKAISYIIIDAWSHRMHFSDEDV
jgi:hypothetical protein